MISSPHVSGAPPPSPASGLPNQYDNQLWETLATMDVESSSSSARAFIRALYDENERIALLAVGRITPNVHQRIGPAGRVLAGRFQAWLRHLNVGGHDIFIGMNPMRSATNRRKKADVSEVRRLQLDLDADGAESLRKVLADARAGRLPQPAIVVRSSRHNYQVLWHTEPGWSPDQAEDTMARLAQQALLENRGRYETGIGTGKDSKVGTILGVHKGYGTWR